jgi:hypothetical protein
VLVHQGIEDAFQVRFGHIGQVLEGRAPLGLDQNAAVEETHRRQGLPLAVTPVFQHLEEGKLTCAVHGEIDERVLSMERLDLPRAVMTRHLGSAADDERRRALALEGFRHCHR